MSIAWGVLWGIMALVVMVITTKYYLPKLSVRSESIVSEAPAASSPDSWKTKALQPTEYAYRSVIFRNKYLVVVVFTACSCIASLCGYSAYHHSVSFAAMLKMTLAMCVLSCVFITDLELMIIPNICSMVLLTGRLVTVLIELVASKNEALVWLINSLIALVASLLLLLITSKVTHGGLGMGDVKLYSSLGFLCGIRAVCFTLMFAFLACALVSTWLLITKKKQLKDTIPLGPFIWLGYGVTVLLSII